MLLPEHVLAGWTAKLGPEVSREQVAALHRHQATHEWFRAEFKTEMGLESLPSVEFANNHLVCSLARGSVLLGVWGAIDRRHPSAQSGKPPCPGCSFQAQRLSCHGLPIKRFQRFVRRLNFQ